MTGLDTTELDTTQRADIAGLPGTVGTFPGQGEDSPGTARECDAHHPDSRGVGVSAINGATPGVINGVIAVVAAGVIAGIVTGISMTSRPR